MFSEQFKDIESRIPKNLVKEYETPEGEKVREFGPVVYGYSMTVGPDGKPKVREFGNIRRPGLGGFKGVFPELSSEIEPLVDLTESEKEVKVVVELPGVEKNEIKINAFVDKVEITAVNSSTNKKYKKTVELPGDINMKNAKSTFKNGILEIIFEKEKDTKKGKEINIS
jgi:HSP20 family protein